MIFLYSAWLIASVVVLLVLAIPGFVLFGLNVFGVESSVNGWFQEKLNLTFHIPLAWWLALILLLIPIAIEITVSGN